MEAADSAPKDDAIPFVKLGGHYQRRKSYDRALEALQKASTITDDLSLHVAIAQVYLESDQVKKAEETIDHVLSKDKGHVEANFLKGRLCLLRNDFDDALKFFDTTVMKRPDYAKAHYFRALCLVGKGENSQALPGLLKAVELDPRFLEARLTLAEFYLRQRNKDLARNHIEIAEKLKPKHIDTLMLKGTLETLEQDPKGAEEVYKSVIEQDPDYAPAYFKLGMLYHSAGRKEEALTYLERALEIDPKQMDALSLLAGMYTKEKEYDAAIGLFDKMERETSDLALSQMAMIQYLKGNTYLAKNDALNARQCFEEAIKIDSSMMAAYISLVRLYEKGNKLEQAISHYETELKNNPDYLQGYMLLGTISELRGEDEKAVLFFRKALAIQSDFGPAANRLAWSLAHKGGNLEEALGFALIARKQMPKNASAMDTLGWIYYVKGNYPKAIKEFRDSLMLEPHNPAFNYHLGMAYYKNYQPVAAQKFLEKALQIHQDFNGSDEANRVLKEINSQTDTKSQTDVSNAQGLQAVI